uniref:hypothetical protein n=1 Tax=Flavobacterium sp. TaxID=239 RepID=UPI00404A37EF
MQKIINNILTFITLTCGLFVNGQNLNNNENVKENQKFTLTISTYNHAESFKDILKYNLKDNNLTISKTSRLSGEISVLFTKKIDENLLEQTKNMNFDKLKEYYFNKCVMITSGNEYSLTISNNKGSKEIHLHHYYIKQIQLINNELNKLIPEELQIIYVNSDTEQNCK